MATYDLYEAYRDARLTEHEQRILQDSARAGSGEADPSVSGHMLIAMERAKTQLDSCPFICPEGADVGIRFPSIDPRGRYSVIDMKFAQRRARLGTFLQTRTPEVQAGISDLQDYGVVPALAELKREMLSVSALHRVYTRASKLCLLEEGRHILHRKARALETSREIAGYDLWLQGLEYASGLKTGEMAPEVGDFYDRRLRCHIPDGLFEHNREFAVPARLEVPFQSFENIVSQARMAAPGSWGDPRAALINTPEAVEQFTGAAINEVPAYAVATADRVLSPAFAAAEEHGLSRSDLIIVDGMTVRQRMELGEMDARDAKAIRNRSALLVSAALMAGRQVEAFLPGADGLFSSVPVPVVRSGYRPAPSHCITIGAWESFFSRCGFSPVDVPADEAQSRLEACRQMILEEFRDAVRDPR